MLKRLALASTLLVAFTAFAGKAQAQDVDVEFTGTITAPNTCTLTFGRNGTLAVTDLDNDFNDISAGSLSASGAETGQVILNCTTSALVIPSVPVGIDPLPNQANIGIATITFNEDGASPFANSQGTSASVNSNGSDINLYVNMRVQNSEPVPEGTYAYTVTVTATPN